MYKVLVTSAVTALAGASIHTMLIEFEDENEAIKAMNKINQQAANSDWRSRIKQYALGVNF